MFGSGEEAALQIEATALDALRRAGEAHRILDVREPWELEVCAFDESLNIPLGQLVARVNELPREMPLVVVCHHGIRSLQAAAWLRDQGYRHAVTLMGGIDAWARQIDPTMPQY